MHSRHWILDTRFQFLTMPHISPAGLPLSLGQGLALPDSAVQSKLPSTDKTEASPVVLRTSFSAGVFHPPLTNGQVWATALISTPWPSEAWSLPGNPVTTYSPTQISNTVITTMLFFHLLPAISVQDTKCDNAHILCLKSAQLDKRGTICVPSAGKVAAPL